MKEKPNKSVKVSESKQSNVYSDKELLLLKETEKHLSPQER